jgi:DNA-binding NtrC family response regulator
VASLTTERPTVRIGSHPSCDLVVPDPTVSRSHCALQLCEDHWRVVDLGSTNGTFVDGTRVEAAHLGSRAALKVGNVAISFQAVDEEIDLQPAESFGGMVGTSPAMRALFGALARVAPLEISVLIQGETGTGKELVARAIHENSPRKDGPFEILDCSSLAPTLIESELFGHERGAFTGALDRRPGLFERANGGTVFIDELGELPLDLQPKLLRALENRAIRRLGGEEAIPLDIRVIAATNRNLLVEVAENRFRRDLYFRLAALVLETPNLRERIDDLPLLVDHALAEHKKRATEKVISTLMRYDWPGNVRELFNVLFAAAALAEGSVIDVEHLSPRLFGEEKPRLSFNEHLPYHQAKQRVLEAFEREYLGELIKRCNGNVSRAARESGIHRKSIERLVKKLGLRS